VGTKDGVAAAILEWVGPLIDPPRPRGSGR
jgi:hypothetical protein